EPLGPVEDGLVRADVRIEGARIAAVAPVGTATAETGAVVDLDGGQLWPCPVDVHTHLDKGHIWPRRDNPDGTFLAALEATGADREANWTAEDVAARMDFALDAAWAHGTRAIRTHLDSIGKQTAISWPVFAEARARWAGRIDLQAVSLFPIDLAAEDEVVAIADTVADHGGVLGAVTYMVPGLEDLLDRVFALAEDRGLDLDFHVDETGDPAARSLAVIAETALRRGFRGKILAGHCCSVAVQAEAEAAATLDRVAEAGMAVVTLPMCNLYLQDRVPGRTPRWRGVTLLHEMAARGIPVCAASDNTRDPFYGYGDLDLVEVYREVTRIAHLDRPVGVWPAAVTTTPAAVMGLAEPPRIAAGAPAELIAFSARFWSELLSRPQSDRRVMRRGTWIDAVPPDYRRLDAIVG
ncbi:MAG: cytosine deaminase, partial [Alphaproteobacteria bacterium]|nr:cytosine deaminase [Alphaproteobacteria bacterium]